MILDIIDNLLKNYQYQVEEIGNNDLSGKNFQMIFTKVFVSQKLKSSLNRSFKEIPIGSIRGWQMPIVIFSSGHKFSV